MSAAVDLSKVEAEFVKVAGAYGTRKGIAYATWRELGVGADVLKKAGDHPARVDDGAADCSSDRSSTTPSAEPSIASLARSGWGMSPTTLPRSLQIPAMSSRLPFGFRT